MPLDSWHTRMERDLIEERGGEWSQSYGVDGTIDGRPVEVRLAKKDDRFRINQDTHEDLLEDDGFYIMDKIGDGKPPKEVSAEEVDDELGPQQEDRGYQYHFVDVPDII